MSMKASLLNIPVGENIEQNFLEQFGNQNLENFKESVQYLEILKKTLCHWVLAT